MLTIETHPDARSEIIHETAYYGQVSLELGDTFVNEIQRTAAKAAEKPGRGRNRGRYFEIELSGPFKKHRVCYVVRGKVLYIVAVTHVRREFEYWLDRLDSLD